MSKQGGMASSKATAVRKQTTHKAIINTVSRRADDDGWADKQAASFVKWINFVFSQSQGETLSVDDDVQQQQSQKDQQDSDVAAIHLLHNRRKDWQIRQRAVAAFRCGNILEKMAQV